MNLRELWNGTRWGSPAGPEIRIDWDKRTIGFYRMSNRLAARLTGWLVIAKPQILPYVRLRDTIDVIRFWHADIDPAVIDQLVRALTGCPRDGVVNDEYREVMEEIPGMSEGGGTMGKHGDGKPADSKPKPAPDTPKHGDNSKAK